MALLSAAELRRIERKYADGISSAAVVNLFQARGERFSEATLRKYVQLGLLPMSRRVGIRGRQRGSSGLYPAVIVRLTNEIKRALETGSTLDDIRSTRVGLSNELHVLRQVSDQLVRRFGAAVARHPAGRRRDALRRDLDRHRRALDREVRELGRLAIRIGNGGGT